jgi:hypothetical protein
LAQSEKGFPRSGERRGAAAIDSLPSIQKTNPQTFDRIASHRIASNRTEQNRTEQNRTEQNNDTTTHQQFY